MPPSAMGFKFAIALALVAYLSSGCVVVVNYTGDAAADLALIFDLGAEMKILDEEDVSR